MQFPDDLLKDSSTVAAMLQRELQQTVYVLADTAYERWESPKQKCLLWRYSCFSCCVDYVAAAHISADAIIHVGEVCDSEMSSLVPCLNVYKKNVLQIEHLLSCLEETKEDLNTGLLIVVDTPYIHLLGEHIV